jgi:protein-disulfide isomerase
MAAYPDKIKLVLKNYPYRYRDYSHLAAEALLAAGDQGKYWEMHDIMIKNSPTLDRDSLIRYAGELNLDLKKFTGDLDSMKHKKLIDEDGNLAVAMDLYNTPTFFINGRKVIGNRPYEYLKKIIEEELEYVKK